MRAEAYYPKGFVQNPMTDAELAFKFRSLCSLVFDEKKTEELVTILNQLDTLENISEFTRLLNKG